MAHPPSADFLDVLVNPRDANIDIVAVHGLNPTNKESHARQTWTSDVSQKLWLSDSEFLPKSLPQARVMLFGYNSNVAFQTSTAGVREQAENLLNRIKLERRNTPSQRPIIFVCHSLGGIVVKRALVEAKLNPVYNPIRVATYGIAFFATPHRGGNHSRLGDVVASVVKGILRVPDNTFMEALKKDSLFADGIIQDFRHQLEDFFVLSFFETLPYKKIGLIVDKRSATLGLSTNRETQIAMAANHSSICKFEDPKSPDYVQAIGNLQELVGRAINAVEDRKKLQELSVPLSSFSLIKPFICPYPENRNFIGRESILEEVMLKFHRDKSELTGQARSSVEQIGQRNVKSLSEEADRKMQPGKNERVTKTHHGTRRITFARIKQSLRSGKFKQSSQMRHEEDLSIGESIQNPRKRDQDFEKINSIAPADQEAKYALRMVENSIQAERVVVLWGLGGVGKSQIAIAYIYWIRQQQPEISVFWIHAATIDRFRQAYLEIAQKCQIPGIEEDKEDVLRLLKNWLEDEKNGRWLMVIDNADNPDDFFMTGTDHYHGIELLSDATPQPKLSQYIPNCSHGSILVTTRSKEAAVKFTRTGLINIREMSEEESEDLILSILTEEELDTDDMKRLTSLLDYLPLALVQASSYIKEASSNIKKYLEIYHDNEESALSLLHQSFEAEGRDSQIPNAVATSWMISFDQIRAAMPRAAEILSLMAFFDRQAIPESLLRNKDELIFQFETAISKLLAYSLITRNVGGNNFDEHRLAHLISRAWLKGNGEEGEWETIALERILDRFPKEDYKDWDICASYLPHAQTIIDRELQKPLPINDGSVGVLMDIVSSYFYFQGSYKSAMITDKQNLDYRSRYLGLEHPDTLSGMNNLASSLNNQGQYEEAEKLYRQVLASRQKILGLEHPDTLSSINNLAMSLDKQGQYEEAEKLFQQALASRQKILGLEHPDTLNSMNDLASSLNNQGQYKEAEKLCRQALASRQKILGLEHPDMLSSMNSLAISLDKQGQYKEAEKLFQQALAGWQKILGLEHPDTLSSINNLAISLDKQGQYKKAEKLYRQVLASRQKILGLEHPDTLSSMNNLASSLNNQGQHKEAEKLCRQVLASRQKILGLEHPDTLNSMNGLAYVRFNQKQYKQAEELFQKVVAGSRKVLGPEHPQTLVSTHNLALALECQGKSGEE